MIRPATARVVGWSVAALATSLVASLAAAQPQPAPPVGQSSPLPPPLRFDRIGPEDGLPAIYVTAVVQDSFGFMWFGTQENGLARFDGTTMKPFPVDPDDPEALPTRWITDLVAQGDGVVWIGSAAGLLRYDGKTDSLTRFQAAPDNPAALSFDVVTTLEVDGQGNLWAGVGDGRINLYQASAGRFRRFDLSPDEAFAPTDILAAADGTIWVATQGGGAFHLDPRAGRVVERLTARRPEALTSDDVQALLEDRAGRLWLGTTDGLFRRDKDRSLHRIGGGGDAVLTDQNITALFEDRAGRLWVGTGNGLNQLDPSRESIVQYQVDPAAPTATGASPEMVTRIMQDREGVIWIASQTGLRKVDPIQLHFSEHVLEASLGAPLAFAEAADGAVWIGTQLGGLLRVDQKARRKSAISSLGLPTAKNFAPLTGGVTALHVDARGELWLAADEVGLVRYDPKTGAHQVYRPLERGLNRRLGRVDALVGDDAQLWLGTQQAGLVRFDRASERFVAAPSAGGDGARPAVHAIARDLRNAQLLWLGVAGEGLVRFDAGRGQATRVALPAPTGKRAALTVHAVHQDRAGTLWLGTDGAELLRLDPGSGRATTMGAAQGIPPGAIYGVLPGRTGHLWLATRDGGLVDFDVKAGVSTRYGRPDGTSDRFQPGASHLGRSGTIYVGGAVSYNSFPAAVELPAPRFEAPIVLTGFTTFNQRAELPRPVWTNPVIALGYRDSTIAFEFAALSFRAPEAIRYQYMLEGVDDDWVETDHGAVSYTNLPGGDYVLRVRAADHRGTWTARNLTVSVDLAVAPWRSWWAFAFYGLIVVAILLSLRLHQQRKLQNVHRTLRLEAAERALDLTRAVQEGFLPADDSFDGYRARVHGYCRPAARAAGDWWWYERLDDNDSLLILAGDVTGHGPGPAMVTSAAATAFKVCHKYDPDLRTSLVDLNDMVLSVGRGRYLMTMSGVVLDGLTGRFVLHSAGGHPPIRISQTGAVHVLPCRGTPLGSHGFASGVKTHQLNPGDRLVIYTDGILELPLERGRMLGLRSFSEMCKETIALDLGDAIGTVVDKADELRRGTPQTDDWTLVMVEWLG